MNKWQILDIYLTQKPQIVQAHLNAAEAYAAMSHANKHKVGAVIVLPDGTTTIGYNGTPPGWDNACEDEQGRTKPDVIHAEQNALDKVTRSTNSSVNSVLFCTRAPCLECAKRLQGAGAIAVFYRETGRNSLPGLAHLEQAGIFTKQIEREKHEPQA